MNQYFEMTRFMAWLNSWGGVDRKALGLKEGLEGKVGLGLY